MFAEASPCLESLRGLRVAQGKATTKLEKVCLGYVVA